MCRFRYYAKHTQSSCERIVYSSPGCRGHWAGNVRRRKIRHLRNFAIGLPSIPTKDFGAKAKNNVILRRLSVHANQSSRLNFKPCLFKNFALQGIER